MRVISSLLVFSVASSVAAQDLGVPLSWRKFGTDRPVAERISISKAAIDLMISQALKQTQGVGEFDGIGFWQSGSTYTALADHDRYAGTTTYKTVVLNNLNAVFNANKFYKYESVSGSSFLLCLSNSPQRNVITAQVASSGTIATKNFKVQGTCDSKSMVGGVFWRTAVADTNINTITYFPLCEHFPAYLATSSSDTKYRDAAVKSFTCNNLLRDTIQGNDCTRSPDSWVFTYNSGKTVEGLTMMQGLTGDSSWTAYMTRVVAAATKSGPWQGSDGIITEGANTSAVDDAAIFKSIFIRALGEVYERSSSQDLRTLVHSYIDVQFNALLDIATSSGKYSNAWAKAYPGTAFFSWGQASALDVMAAAYQSQLVLFSL
ncbi:glycoside hydrolase family 76 protein [Flagelloscypha sp. PMI_526]|nr:glycoside hydrolase family 76 protein [Flagelloscypha sp. PMI_526]